MIAETLSEFLEELFKKEDLKNCFVVDIIFSPPGKVEVYVDSDTQLTIKHCEIISRALEKKIESEELLGEKYKLDVSSPGLDRPLKKYRQYVKNIGRKIRVFIEGQEKPVEGILKEVDPAQITLEASGNNSRTIEMKQINKAKVLVSFK